MNRTWTLALLGALAAQGCIVYEDRPHGHNDCGDVPCHDSGWTGGGTTEEPVAEADLRLTVAEGRAGQQLLSTLVNAGEQEIDLLAVEAVSFSRDVAVLDLMARDNEVVLLLAVHPEAQPGAVDVSVTSQAGAGWILEQPFMIVDESGECTTGQGGTGSTTDTACP